MYAMELSEIPFKLATSFATSTKIDAIGTFQTPTQMPCVPEEVLIQGRQGRDSH